MNPYEELRGKKLYHGKQEPRKISASQCGAPLLQQYLSQTTIAVEQPNSFSKATIGSIAHKGMEELITSPNILKEHEMERLLPNGWKITGTADAIDTDAKTIIDYKFEMNYAYKMHQKDGPDASYNIQLAAYSWLYGENFDGHIMSFITDHSPIKKDHPAEAIQVTHVPIHDNMYFEYMMLGITDSLDSHIKAGTPPAQCDDLWWRKVNGTSVATRCKYYCKYNDVCPHYSSHSSAAANVASWG